MPKQPWRRRGPPVKLLLHPWLRHKQDAAGSYEAERKTFRRLIVNIILLSRVCRCFRSGLKGFQGFQLIEKDIRGEFDEEKKGSQVVFERHEFTVSKDHFPFRAIQITKKPPAWRTDAEVRHLRNRLQHLESFQQYSPALQNLLAKVVRFEQFGRRRVIIKKGQWAVSFYFIYFGTVAVTDDEDGSSAFVDSAPTTIARGACFGEVALLQRIRRMATVVCMEETELLVVDRKDFFKYKLDKELQRELKSRYEFLRTVDLLETLPDSSVETIANICKAERFHYGQVIANDISDPSNIIFIAKGICEVLRLVDLSTCPSYHKWLSKQLCFPNRKLQTREKRRLAAEIACVDRFKSTMWNSYSGQKLNDLKEYYVRKAYDSFARESSDFTKSRKSVVIAVDTCERSPSSEQQQQQQQQEDDEEVVQKVVSGRAFEKKLTYSTSYGEMPSSVSAAVYIRVDELRKGEYITNLQDNRSMILVSQGAEIIRMKKEKIEEFSDDATLTKLNNLKIKYPSDDELCQVFLRQNSWEMFKKDLLNLVIQPKLSKMVHPPHPCPTEEIYSTWCMNQAGILDLSALRQKKEPPPEMCRYVPVYMGHAKETLPLIQPKLIHGINVLRSNLDGAF
nr:cyclic nucleotide-binding domain-containing protein 2 isoform X1 [Pogona vitticeps]